MIPLIIAFGYKKGSGKNTAAKFLSTHIRCTHPGFKVAEVSFAEKLKDISFQLWGWAGLKRGIYYESHYEEKEKVLPRLGKSPRQIWIEVGNKMREVYGGTWIDFALNGVNADIIIITDLGYINEANAVIEKGGCCAKITRDGIPRGTDAREVQLDDFHDWCRILDNNGDLESLHSQMVKLWDEIYEEKIKTQS